MTALVKPPALLPGDMIAFVAPSAGLASLTLHRLEQAKRMLESHGYRVKIYDSVTRSPSQNVAHLIDQCSAQDMDPAIYGAQYPCYGSADARTRAQDLMDAFLDPSVRAIICTIGGLNSHELLEYLDFDAIHQHPTIFIGYSDITSLHMALQSKAKLVTYYGPSVICQLGEFPSPVEYTMEYLWKAIASPVAIGRIEPSLEWTDDKTADWVSRTDIDYVNAMKKNTGYEWLRRGRASGPLIGGCLPVLLNVRGTQFMPDVSGSVFLLETPESDANFKVGMSLDLINMVLGVLRADGTFSKITGLVVGRVYVHSDANVAEIKRLLLYHTRGYTFPILYGVDTGHTDPILTLPLGCAASIDSETNLFSIDEPAVTARHPQQA